MKFMNRSRYFVPFAIVSFAFITFAILAILTGTYRHDQKPLGPSPPPSKGPNIIFILADDQDLHMDSLSYMPFVKKHLLDEGTFYKRHYCTVALCCPSRVNLWTGKAPHNTNVTDVNPPYGGYPKFISQGFNNAYLPVWLQDAGYNTYYTGKLMNSHSIHNYDHPFPAGFNGSDFLLDPYTYDYLNQTFQRNRDLPVSHEGEYATDVLASKAYGFLEDALKSERPFFLGIAPIAPHSNLRYRIPDPGRLLDTYTVGMTAPIPAKRHKNWFKDVIVPRTPNFNPEEPSSVSWISKLPRQDTANVDSNDAFYRSRLQALQALDEMVNDLFAKLEDRNLLENTYIMYSSDNGYHIGQHRLQPGKECGFEEDINVPLIIRGPGVPAGEVTNIVTSHTDIAPTIFSLIGKSPRYDFDGAAIPVTSDGLELAKDQRHEHVNVEYWGFALTEGEYGGHLYWNNTYKSLRILGAGYNLYYAVWCNNEHELYDLESDPYQLHNIHPQAVAAIITTELLKHPIAKVIARLDSLLMVLKSCKGVDCIKAWNVIHPDGSVKDLWGALDTKFDDFYAEEQDRVEFSRCERGYILDAEGPQNVKVWSEMT